MDVSSFAAKYRTASPGLKESPRGLRPGVSIPAWKWRQLQAGMRFDNCHDNKSQQQWLCDWMQTPDAAEWLLQDKKWLR